MEKGNILKRDYIEFDVMDGDRFVCTMRYPHCRLFQVNMDDILEYVYSQRPSFRKRKNLHIELCEDHECNIKTFVGKRLTDMSIPKRRH